MITKPIPVPIIDLFAGPGGLGEGFSSYRPNGRSAFRIALSIEKEAIEHETLKLRAFFRQFAPDDVPDEYYALLRNPGRCETDKAKLFAKHPDEAASADREAFHETLGRESTRRVGQKIRDALKQYPDKPLVLIGGPPCQAYSLAGRSRNKGKDDYVPEEDGRQFLYQEYLQTLADFQPAVFVMENVKGLLSAQLDGKSVFENILVDLAHPAKAIRAYGRGTRGKASDEYEIRSLVVDNGLLHRPRDFIVHAEDYGIPQKRHRVILLGVRKDYACKPRRILIKQDHVPLEKVIADLPSLRSGLSKTEDSNDLWQAFLRAAPTTKWFPQLKSELPDLASALSDTVRKLTSPPLGRGMEYLATDSPIQYKPDWYQPDRARLPGVCNHTTRSHIQNDLYRYLFVSSFARVYDRSPELSDFPDGLLPKHKNVAEAMDGGHFADRFRVQRMGVPSTTVVSHISKDGHYYIHYNPAQCRSLTVREAARLQTFPDNYLFWGNRTQQYHQVGNAVPPLLARQIAEIVYELVK